MLGKEGKLLTRHERIERQTEENQKKRDASITIMNNRNTIKYLLTRPVLLSYFESTTGEKSLV